MQAACAHNKAVRLFADALAQEHPSAPGSKTAALTALDALCAADPGPNLRKLAWSGALPVLVNHMRQVSAAAPEERACSLRLLLSALAQDGRYADTLCTPGVLEALSEFIADPQYPTQLQAGAAGVLSHVAAIPSKKADAIKALTDCALPRACEVVHQAKEAWGTGAVLNSPISAKHFAQMLGAQNGSADGSGIGSDVDAQLQAACATLIAHLATGSRVCCHVILFHTQVLHALIEVLVGSHQYLLADALLRAAGRYAANPTETI